MKFYKYTGAGNDFILFNDMDGTMPVLSSKQIQFLCDRHFGIGADGVMFLKKSSVLDFEMDYFNPDGSSGTMCGNGGRCLVAFARKLNVIKNHTKFLASDGMHEAFINDINIVKLKMIDTEGIKHLDGSYFCDTGAPHHIVIADEIKDINVVNEGRKIRFSERYKKNGTNVNFVKFEGDHSISIRTYERGVENETLACGTGSVASALLCAELNEFCSGEVMVKTRGGLLKVSFVKNEDKYEDIWLTGPAEFVFEGEIELRN
jgi:diaminopimelate epimerase